MLKLAEIGDKVQHNFSGQYGTIFAIRSDPKGYNYYIQWDIPDDDRSDWYKSEILQSV